MITKKYLAKMCNDLLELHREQTKQINELVDTIEFQGKEIKGLQFDIKMLKQLLDTNRK